MKLTLVFCLFLGLLSSMAETTAQETKLNLKIQSGTVKDVIEEIEQQTEYSFMYDNNVFDVTRAITVNVDNSTVSEVLSRIIEGENLAYEIVNRYIVISAKNPSVTQQTIQKVSGTVTNVKGEILPGVTVIIQGTTNGTVTDFDGNYSLSSISSDATLVFSFIGMKTQEVPVAGKSQIDVTMQEESIGLDEVVAIGYGTMKKSDLTGSVSSVSSDDFNKGPQLSTQQLIQGKISGVNISQNSGKPGGSNTIRIRGGTSIGASNDPLYVIDGVPISTSDVGQSNIGNYSTNIFDQEPTNPLMTLNPNDIESVNVLKDASATAIYGSRGANGVIMITTKRGKAGRSQVSYDVSSGFSRGANTLDVLSADQYRETVIDIAGADKLTDKGANTDWQDLIYRTAFQQNHYLSLSGGNESTSYRASVGYGTQEGIMLASSLEQENIRVNINHKALDDKLSFDLRMNYGQNLSDQSAISNTVGSEFGSSLNYEAYVFNPTYPVRDSEGNYNHVPPFRINPVSYSTDVIDQKSNSRFLGNLSTTYQIVDPLSLKVNLGYNRQTIDRNSYISKTNPQGEGSGGYASVQKLADYSKLIETILSFDKTFGKNTINAIAGYSYQYFKNEGLWNTATGFLSDEFRWYSLQAASSIESVTSFLGSNKLISMYGRVNYNYDSRFLFTATVRRDGSSRFGAGNKWGIFPSGAASWRVSQEKFFQSSTISDLKLRASYGVTGNQEIGNYRSISTLGASSSGYLVGGSRVTVVLPQQYANPDLKWEQTAQLNLGLNFGFFDQRIFGSIDYYRKKTSDLLLEIAVPSPSPITTQLANVGSVENKGIEFEINAKAIDKGVFTWDVNFNLSANRNKILSLSNDQYQGNEIKSGPAGGLSGVYSQLIKEGESLGIFWGRVFTGIVDGVEQFEEGNTIIGNAQPDFTFGFSNTFTYKNWDMNINMRGSVGNDVYNATANYLGYLVDLPARNVITEAITSGVTKDQPKQFSSRWIEDGSFLRLDNVSLGYNFNVKSTFLSNARIYVSGQNLFLITSYSGLDPEVNSDVTGGSGVLPLGIDYMAYPKAKTISIGANITF
ncbi:TonB-dependent receptor [Sunxiuqinia indica]|uniref:TonB-dependent receptor n=1 Tax=Sunxiuqinia indica TaxID=2692584 RepID=UPI0019160040|nr:TonB-dependent receptor [Sunxiuqinia indica]